VNKYYKLTKNLFPWIILFLIIIFNLILLNWPLTNILGYEFSAFNGIVISFLVGILTIWFIDNLKNSMSNFHDVIKNNILFYLAVIIIPFLISFINTVLFGICPLSNNAFFYLVITVPSFLIGIALAFIISKLFCRFRYLLFVLIYLVVLLLFAVELYLNPQIYFYNSIIGFFPGTIYDEDISVGIQLVFYRILNVIYFLFGAYLINIIGSKSILHKYLFTVIMMLLAVVFILCKPALGFATTKRTLKTQLTGELNTEHFTIIYSQTLTNIQLENLALHHEYYYTSLKNDLGVEPSDRIISYIFKNNEQKRILFGAGNADVAKPWLYNIYTTYENYDNSLKHELAHVFAAEFGVTPFKVADKINPSMIEGFAMMAEDNYNNNDIHYMAKLAFFSGYKFPITELFNGLKFFSQTSSLSYIYAGSFIKYLKESYGIEKIKKLYSDLDFNKHFENDLSSLAQDYYKFLQKQDFIVNEHEANLFFGTKPIFKRTCARYVAVKLSEAWKLYNNGTYPVAENTFKELFQYSENYSALVGYVNCLLKTGKISKAMEIMENELPKYDSTSFYYNLEMIYADVLVRNNKLDEAKKIYELIKAHNPSTEYYSTACNRLLMLENSADILLRYLTGSNYDKYTKLYNLYGSVNNVSTLPSLIYLSNQLNENYEDLKLKIGEPVFEDNQLSSYSAFIISKLAVENLDYAYAMEYCSKSIINAPKQKISIYNEVLSRIDWFIENSEEVKNKFYFTD